MLCKQGLWSAAGVICVVLGGHASAAPLAPGSTIPAAGDPDPTGGSVFAGPLPAVFVATTFTGSLTSTVITGDTTNTLGGLTFTFKLTNNAPSPHSLVRLTLNGFAGFALDASFETPAAGLAPATIDRSAGGDVVGFTFSPAALPPGTSSALLVIQTDAPDFTFNVATAVNGSSANNILIYTPAVPEPATAAALLLPAAYRFRRPRA